MLTVDFERFRIAPGMMALDIGCGQGRHSLEFLRRGCRTVSMDLALADLRYSKYLLASLARDDGARPAAPPLPGGAARVRDFMVLRADALRLPFGAEAFDRVICSEVLEHVADPRQAVAELWRVLRPGGLMAASVPTPFTEWAFRFASDDYFNSPGGHVRIFTARRLFALLQRQGLQVIDLHFEHAFHSVYWWVRGVCGLHDEAHPAIRMFRKALTHVMFSPPLTRAERWCNHVLPKSMVFYARKT